MTKITPKNVLKISVILLLAAVAYFVVVPGTEKINYLVEGVKFGNIKRTVHATGEVGAIQLVNVGAQVSGQIEKIYVTVGQNVQKGDPIADIDSVPQQNELEIAKAKLNIYQAQLESANITLQTADKQFKREQKLATSGATSTESLENAETAFAVAKASVDELNALIRQAEVSVSTAETNLGYTKIIAPLDGTIVSVPVKEGQTLNNMMEAPTIAQVANLENMEVLIKISEGDITKVKPGMTVEYNILSEPSKMYKTELKSIDPGLTTLTNGQYTGIIESDVAVYYYGRLVVPNTEQNLYIGMSTNNEIIIDSADNVMLIPSSAVSERNGRQFVSVLDNQKPVEKEIVIGISDSINTQVISGLNAGDMVISAQSSSAEPAPGLF